MLNEYKRKTMSPETSQSELRTTRARVYPSISSSSRSLSPDNSTTKPRIPAPPKPSTSNRSSQSSGPVKDPSDFVKDVLLNIPDGANNPRVLEVITLFEQLQTNNNRLQFMYTEAKNTIDSCCIKAKDPAPCPNQRCIHFDPNSGRSLVHTLKGQAKTLVQQVNTFMDTLRAKTRRPPEFIKGLLLLVEELNTLEKAYLIGKVEHKLHQHQCKNITVYDSEGALEQLISQLRLRVEGLKVKVEHMLQEYINSLLTPSQNHQPSPPSEPTDVEATWKYSQGDSGFVGSDSIGLTPAAAHPAHHQMSSRCDLGGLLHHFTLYMTNLRERLETALQEQPSRTVPPPSGQPRPSSTPPDKDKTWRLPKLQHSLLQPLTRQQRSLWADPPRTGINYQEPHSEWSNRTATLPQGAAVQSKTNPPIPTGLKWKNDWRKSNWNGPGH